MKTDILTSLIASLQSVVLLLTAQLAALPAQHMSQSSPNSLTGAAALATALPDSLKTSVSPTSFTAINNLYKSAVVNILCRGSGQFKGGTATGVIISPTGLILTNAHMAQYFLLEQATDAPLLCTVRTGSPAQDTYRAKVVYMPPAWVAQHASQITQAEQRGTGEDDYALLQITSSVAGMPPVPSTFPFIKHDASMLSTSTQGEVLVRAYPAEFLGSHITLRALHAVATVTTLGSFATFNDPTIPNPKAPTIDLVSLGGTIVAQGGSSGGAVINHAAQLIGLVVTSTRKANTEDRDLKAITLSHINMSLKQHTNKSLDEIISLSEDEFAEQFGEQLLQSAQVFANAFNHK